jgi:ferritin-like metal-binding protein YciE
MNGFEMLISQQIPIARPMKTPPLNLIELFNSTIAGLYAADKKYLKCYADIAKTAMLEELSHTLSPEQTNLENHLNKLSSLIDLQGLKTSRITQVLDDQLYNEAMDCCGFAKQKSLLKDIQLLHCAQQILQSKIIRFESLYLTAKELKMEQAVHSIQQIKADNEHTYADLVQIAHDKLYPAAHQI